MRHVSGFCHLCCCAAVLAGCARPNTRATGDTAAADTAATAAAPASPGAAGMVSLAQLAGQWNTRTVPEAGPDTTPTTFVMVATADSSGWSFRFPNREPVPVRVVAVEGDSVVIEAGPYESVRRQGVQVQTRSAFRLQGGRLVGGTVARYATSGPDSVLRLRSEGTRAP